MAVKVTMMATDSHKHFLLASDFDQTLSFRDSGQVLAEMLGVKNFQEKVDGLANSNLVQQGGELAYLVRHDPEFRGVRRSHLVEAGRRVRLKEAIPALMSLLESNVHQHSISFFVISAAPREIVVSALHGIVPPGRILATDFGYDEDSGEVNSIRRVAAGFGKVTILDALATRMGIPSNRIMYVGDGSSDVHVMLHVNNGDGFTICVSENSQLARIAKATVLSDNALSIAIPVLDQVFGWQPADIRSEIESRGLLLADWQKARTDRVRIVDSPAHVGQQPAVAECR